MQFSSGIFLFEHMAKVILIRGARNQNVSSLKLIRPHRWCLQGSSFIVCGGMSFTLMSPCASHANMFWAVYFDAWPLSFGIVDVLACKTLFFSILAPQSRTTLAV